MKLHKHSETFLQTSREWLTIFIGENHKQKFVLYGQHKMPDSVEVNWAPPITSQEEVDHVEIPAIPVHHLPDVRSDPGSSQGARPAPQAHVTFSADPPGAAY